MSRISTWLAGLALAGSALVPPATALVPSATAREAAGLARTPAILAAIVRASVAPAPLLLATLSSSSPARAAEIPKNDGWVTDLAGIISAADEQALEAELEAWKRGSGHEIAVLTVASLNGEPIERFALEVGRVWAMGSKEKKDAAILIVAKNERALRIEVGRGLEGVLPDILCARIVSDVITPQFKRGNFSAGIRAGVSAMRAAVGGDLSKLPPERAPRDRLVGATMSILMMVLILVFRVMSARRGGGVLGGRRAGMWISPAGFGGGRSSGSGFSGFGGGGGFSGGGSSGSW